MANHGKIYNTQLETFSREEVYPLSEAIAKVKTFSGRKFDQTVDMAFRLGIDPRQSDQAIRGAMSLPNGTGTNVRVVVAAEGAQAEAARDAGADEVGMSELLEKISGGWLDFDVMIATPDAMREVRKLGRVLGPRGLMPNPKTGTVSDDVAAAVQAAKAGRIEYRADRGGCIHVPIGKVSFSEEDLEENAMAVIQTLTRARPASTKGIFMLSCTLSATMSPGVKVDTRPYIRS